MTCREAGMIIWVQVLGCPPPKIWQVRKTSKICLDFGQLQICTANISEMDGDIKDRKSE